MVGLFVLIQVFIVVQIGLELLDSSASVSGQRRDVPVCRAPPPPFLALFGAGYVEPKSSCKCCNPELHPPHPTVTCDELFKDGSVRFCQGGQRRKIILKKAGIPKQHLEAGT